MYMYMYECRPSIKIRWSVKIVGTIRSLGHMPRWVEGEGSTVEEGGREKEEVCIGEGQ